MADQTYDVVMVGAGNKSIVTAMYLAKYAKLSVGVFEDRHEACAGWCSEETMGGGFNNDPCSTLMVHYPMYFGPVWEDFPELRDYGMRFVPHPVGMALAKSDGKCMLIWSEGFDPDQKKTAESIAAFSKKDADTWLRLWELWKTKWQQAFYEVLFNPPSRTPQEDPIMRLVANPKESGMDPYWLTRSPFQLCRELFESGEFLTLFCKMAESGGYGPLEGGMGILTLLATFLWTGGAAAARGGTHNNAHACVRVVTNNGGEIFCRRSVKKILIENGRAKGVLLEDGTEVEAKVAVVSGVNIHQLMFDLVGPEHFDPVDVARVNTLEADFISLYWFQVAFREPPIFKAEDYDPNLKWSGFISLLQKPPSKDSEEEYALLRKLGGRIPMEQMKPSVINHSMVDTSRVPKGMASVLFDVYNKSGKFHKNQREFVNDYWGIFEDTMDIMYRFTKNVTRDSLYGASIEGPKYLQDLSKSYYHGNCLSLDNTLDQMTPGRPTPALASGRMPVKGLYATGMSFQQGGWAGMWNGYSLYKILAEDLGLPKPWEDKGRVPEKVETAYKYRDRFTVIPKDVPGYPEPKI